MFSFLKKYDVKKKVNDFEISIPVYSIYDKKAQKYSPPFLAYNHLVAVRMVCSSADSPDSLLRLYSHDYRLDQIAIFCDSSGEIISLKEKEIVAELQNIVGELSSTGVDKDDRTD